jgi:hypothetical protein
MKTFRHNADGSGDIIETTVRPGPYSTSPEVTEDTVLVHVSAEDLAHWQAIDPAAVAPPANPAPTAPVIPAPAPVQEG